MPAHICIPGLCMHACICACLQAWITLPILTLPVSHLVYAWCDWLHSLCAVCLACLVAFRCVACLGPCLPAYLPCLVFHPLVWFGPHVPQWGEAGCRAVHAVACYVCSSPAGPCVWLGCLAPSCALGTHTHRAHIKQPSKQASIILMGWGSVCVHTYFAWMRPRWLLLPPTVNPLSSE